MSCFTLPIEIMLKKRLIKKEFLDFLPFAVFINKGNYSKS